MIEFDLEHLGLVDKFVDQAIGTHVLNQMIIDQHLDNCIIGTGITTDWLLLFVRIKFIGHI